MTLLSALAVAFAAFCVWLTARIVNRRERWAKLTLATTIGLLVLYVASFGPACWWFAEAGKSESLGGLPVAMTCGMPIQPHLRCAPQCYWPIGWIAMHGPDWLKRAISMYANLVNPPVLVPHPYDGSSASTF